MASTTTPRRRGRPAGSGKAKPSSPKSKPKPKAKPSPKPKAKPSPKPKPKPESTKPEPEPKTISKPKPKSKARAKAKPKAKTPPRKPSASSTQPRKRAKKDIGRVSPVLSVPECGMLPPPLSIGATPPPTLIMDTGGWSIKHGVHLQLSPPPSSSNGVHDETQVQERPEDQAPTESPNVSAKAKHQLTTLLSDQIDEIHNKSQLRVTFPQERGYTTDLGCQFHIWGHILEKEGLDCRHPYGNGGVQTFFPSINGGNIHKSKKNDAGANDMRRPSFKTHSCAVFLLTQPFTPRCVLEREDEVWFRDFGFGRVTRRLVQCCSAYRYLNRLVKQTKEETDPSREDGSKKFGPSTDGVIDDETGCCCVVDCGFSLTHIVPTVETKAIEKGIRRINVGGKILTNHLKELISYRQWNMMDEFYIVNEVKEKLCFACTTGFSQELRKARYVREGERWFDRNFILPDFTETFEGTVRLPRMIQMEKDMEEWDMKEEERRRKREEKKNEVKKENVGGCGDDHEDNQDHDKSTPTSTDGKEKSIDNPNENKTDQKINNERTHDEIDNSNDNNDDNSDTSKNDNDNKKIDHRSDSDSDLDSDTESPSQIRNRILRRRQLEILRREEEERSRQILSLSVERFTVPELLFRPSDVGLDQVGLAEGIVRSIEACDAVYRAALYNNVLLTGGTVKMKGFKERLEVELRESAPAGYEVRVVIPEDPVGYAWMGAKDWIRDGEGDRSGGGVDREDWETRRKCGDETGDIWSSTSGKQVREGHITI